MTWTGSVLLAWVGAIVLAVLAYVVPRVRRQRKLRARYGDVAVASHGVFKWLALIPVVLLISAVACLGLAFGQFRLSKQATEGTVVLAMDVSRSMDQTDVRPDRLAAARSAADTFLAQVPAGFRVGLVTFAGGAQTAVAPTQDRAAVSAALGSLSTSTGTVIGDGLAKALDTIEGDQLRHGADPAAVVLLSDGRDTGSKITPLEAADRARSMGIPVFTVVIGATAPAGSSSASATPVKGGADADLLGSLAGATGAQEFTAQSSGELTGVYQTLGSRLTYDLAVGGSGRLFMLLGAALAVAAGLSAVAISRRR